MSTKQLIGIGMLCALVGGLMWQAAREGHLSSLLQGALWGGGISLIMITAMRLISET